MMPWSCWGEKFLSSERSNSVGDTREMVLLTLKWEGENAPTSWCGYLADDALKLMHAKFLWLENDKMTIRNWQQICKGTKTKMGTKIPRLRQKRCKTFLCGRDDYWRSIQINEWITEMVNYLMKYKPVNSHTHIDFFEIENFYLITRY